ncbi:N-acetyl-gamma-glutamyl-phosphate reductase [Sporosarcina sp. Te-1]|uniref:N-acetyl-gamma-glutamyl-phosphate reductase n=1 Tax=Sporosarcina sp. Te-1 TaxID=2818390 RepID=UPI001A9FEDBC|nr:N-acetyl-gamma-glutamyl-phosphate reductase [Sporosarcina sp. Te-1]QTD43345.1 N-acetyl-gamma-glutamyl-phosphate reductase [Sporosarcina sp. Te-1]
MKVGIIGATGYGGVELLRLLHGHPYVNQISLFTSSDEGMIFSRKYAHLKGLYDIPLQSLNMDALVELDVVFASTPAGVTSTLFPPLLGKKPKLIDLSGDFRLKDPRDYRHWYKKQPATEEMLEASVYGLSEWNRTAISEAQLIANPGCYPTAVLLSLLPLLTSGLIDGNSVIIDAKSGVSGAGNTLSRATHFAETNENLSIYKLHEHQHIPEIEQAIGQFAHSSTPITFTTHLVPMTRGIMATSYAPVTGNVKEEDLYDCLEAAYQNNPFVRIIREAAVMGTNQVYGSNYCDIHVKVDQRTNRATIVSVIDNLIKGAAGQAVQNMNIQYGFEETAGLTGMPLYI